MKSNRKERRDGDFMDHETAFYSFILEVEINGMIPCYFKHDFAYTSAQMFRNWRNFICFFASVSVFFNGKIGQSVKMFD